MRILAAVAVSLILAAVPAHAQNVTGVTLAVTPADAEIPYQGSGSIATSVLIGCATLLQNPTASTVTISAKDAPAWFVLTPTSGTVSPTGCANPTGAVTVDVAVPFTVTTAAPGVVPQTVDLVATFGTTESEAKGYAFTVAYFANYTVVPKATFPVTVTGGVASFPVEVTQNSNAPSMVMFEKVSASPGVASGLQSVVFMPPETKTFNFTYTAPQGPWTNATVTFTNFGHYLIDGVGAGDFVLERKVAWTFVNGDADSESGDKKSSPMVEFLLPALLIAAFVASRRRE